jgi:mRNA-degrading endonuclease toxin of MazEF toxin-antitoxin module
LFIHDILIDMEHEEIIEEILVPVHELDVWNELKKTIDSSKTYVQVTVFPKESEVWMTHLGKNIGFEQNGSGASFSRPVVVVKKFNNHMFWVVPLSTKQKEFTFYFNYIDLTGQPVSAVLAQMKLMSIKRFKRNLYNMPTEIFATLKEKLRTFL